MSQTLAAHRQSHSHESGGFGLSSPREGEQAVHLAQDPLTALRHLEPELGQLGASSGAEKQGRSGDSFELVDSARHRGAWPFQLAPRPLEGACLEYGDQRA